MKRGLHIFQVFFLLVFLLACSKSQHEIDFPCLTYSEPVYRIKEIVETKGTELLKSTYYYDSLNRLQRRCDSGAYYQTVIWKYTLDKVLLLRQDSTIIYFLNIDSNEYAITPSTGHYLWEYNSEGYLVKQTESWTELGTQIRNYEYGCWNNVKISSGGYDTQGNPIGGGITTNEFYNDKINTIGNENIGIKYWGKQNNCLTKCITSTYKERIDTLALHSYEFDSLNRVIKEIEKKPMKEDIIRYYKYY